MTTSAESQFTTYRPDLAETMLEFDLDANQRGMVGLFVAPALEVMMAGGQYPIIHLKSLLQDRATNRTPDGGYITIEGHGDKKTYNTEEHGVQERVDQNDSRRFGSFWDAEQLAAMRCRDAVLRAHNQRVIAAALGVSNTTAATALWSAKATANPVLDVRAAQIAIRNRTGAMANAMVCDWEAAKYLVDADLYVDRMKHQDFQDVRTRRALMEDAIAIALDLEFVRISGSVKNTANEAATPVIAAEWDRTQALVFARNTGRDTRTAQFMRTFHWGEDGSTIGTRFDSWFDPNRRSDMVRNRMQTDEVIIYGDLAQRITGVLS